MDDDLASTVIHCDFELAAINVLCEAFPDAEIDGCFFHLMQNMKKKVNEHGLSVMYNESPQFALSARMIVSLTFVPTAAVESAFQDLQDFLPDRYSIGSKTTTWDVCVAQWARSGKKDFSCFFIDDIDYAGLEEVDKVGK